MSSREHGTAPGVAMICLFLCACGSSPSKKASGNQEVVAVNDTGLAELKGQWSASAYVDGYGLVTLNLAMDASGHGYYMVHVKGLPLSGYVQAHSWDGHTLEGTVEGSRRHLRGKIDGNDAIFDIPGFGQVSLHRHRKQ